MCNVIKSMGCSRELTGKKLEGQQERLHCQHIHMRTYVLRSISILHRRQQSHEICCRCCHCELTLYGSPSIQKTTRPPRMHTTLWPRSLRLAGSVSKLPNLYEYLTRVDNSMTYPADVVIRSGAYMVRQRSRRRLARSPQMHTTF